MTSTSGSDLPGTSISRCRFSGGTISGFPSLMATSLATVGKKAKATAGACLSRAGAKRLGDDVQRDEDQDRRKDGARNQLHEEGHVSEHASESDEEPGQQGVAGPGAHALVRGLTDVWSRLRNAATESCNQRGDRFGQQDASRVVTVAGDARTLRDIDAARLPSADRMESRSPGN